jgi:site-specific DNA-cytosine methylase
MFAVIRHTKPEWVIAENVRGLVTWNEGMVLETVCADLESEGYEVQPFIIPAVAVGAAHRRDRVWIIGKMAPTPTQTDYKSWGPNSKQAGIDRDVKILGILTGQETGKKLRLQPAMTQWMMGYPDLWTEFPIAEPDGEKTASKPTATE